MEWYRQITHANAAEIINVSLPVVPVNPGFLYVLLDQGSRAQDEKTAQFFALRNPWQTGLDLESERLFETDKRSRINGIGHCAIYLQADPDTNTILGRIFEAVSKS